MAHRSARVILIAAIAAFCGSTASAYIERLYPLKDVIRESDVILEGVVEKADVKRKTCVIRVKTAIKGKTEYEQIRVNFGVGQNWHPDVIMKHIVVNTPAVVFYNAEKKSIVYLNHFFFQLYGDPKAAPDKAWWNFTHVEIFMNRTFDGTPTELLKIVQGMLAGKPALAPHPRKRPLTRALIEALPGPGPDGTVGPGFESLAIAPKEERKTCLPDREGFLRNWLVLDPIPLEGGVNFTEAGQKEWFDRDWLADAKEAAPKPKDKLKLKDRELNWQATAAYEFSVDFSGVAAEAGKDADNSLFLCFVYIYCEQEIPDVRLAIGSDDSSVWKLNGVELIRVYEARGVRKDNNVSKPVTLKKGLNVLAAGIINGGGPTGACARFIDKKGRPVLDYLHDYSPTPPPLEY